MRTSQDLFAGIPQREVAIVVAHPDDESIACVEPLMRYPGALVIHVTDGAPYDRTEWKSQPTRAAYAAMRTRECKAALDVIGHRGHRLALGIVDTSTFRRLVHVTCELADIFVRHHIRLVFTHAYDGGHPDHDAVAFCVHAVKRRNIADLRIVEVPLYRMSEKGGVWQEFVHVDGYEEMIVSLSAQARYAKLHMLAAHESQRAACERALPHFEFFREAPRYDFSLPPNGGLLARNYGRARLTAATVVELTAEACLVLSE